MDCNILDTKHWMLGLDFHNAVIPPAPAVIPLVFHLVTMPLLGIIPGPLSTVAQAKTVRSDKASALQRGSDAGMGIPHIALPNPLNVLLPAILVGSSSVSEFGSFSVLVENSPVATACFVVVNINLNCGDPMSTTTGIVIAVSTNQAGMTLGDFIASLISMVVDIIIQFISSEITGNAGGSGTTVDKGITKIIGGDIAGYVERKIAQQELNVLLGHTVGYVIGWLRDKALAAGFTPNSAEPNTTPAAVNDMFKEGELIK
ncbi:MAG: hypothetical protein ABI402_11120 [Ferruginibacter sp.]